MNNARRERTKYKVAAIKVLCMSGICGVIFPIPNKFVDRLFIQNRNVFVKYIARTTRVGIMPKHKVLFYASHGSKDIAGEGVIERILFLTPDEAFARYCDKVFLNKDELKQYTSMQPKRDSSKKMLVLVLSKLKRYSQPVRFKQPITMAGQYLTKEEYKELLKMVRRTSE